MTSFRPVIIALLLLGAFSSAAFAGENFGNRRSWPESLTSEQRQEAERILAEVQPRVLQLRTQMREKMKELQSFAYRQDGDDQELSRLGGELQSLRDELRRELQTLDERLAREAGLTSLPHRGRSCSSLGTRVPQNEQ